MNDAVVIAGLAALVPLAVTLAFGLIAIEELIRGRSQQHASSVRERVWARRHHAAGGVYGAAILFGAILVAGQIDDKLSLEVLGGFAVLFLYMLLLLRFLNAWPFRQRQPRDS